MRLPYLLAAVFVAVLALLAMAVLSLSGTAALILPDTGVQPIAAVGQVHGQAPAAGRDRHTGMAATSPYTVYLPTVQNDLPTCALAPSLISPTNGSELTTLVPRLVHFTRNKPVSCTIIQIDDDPSFGSPIQYTSGALPGERELRLFGNLQPATTYHWRVYERCGTVESPTSSVYTFVTLSGGEIPPAPALISPANGTTGVGAEITATWSAVSDATEYQVHRCVVGRGCSLYRPTETSYPFRFLQADTEYEWWVRAYNGYAYGPESPRWRFTTGSFAR